MTDKHDVSIVWIVYLTWTCNYLYVPYGIDVGYAFHSLSLVRIYLCLLRVLTNYFCWYLQYPVYFAYEDDKINAVLADVRRGDATGQPATATTGGLVNTLIAKIIRPVEIIYICFTATLCCSNSISDI